MHNTHAYTYLSLFTHKHKHASVDKANINIDACRFACTQRHTRASATLTCSRSTLVCADSHTHKRVDSHAYRSTRTQLCLQTKKGVLLWCWYCMDRSCIHEHFFTLMQIYLACIISSGALRTFFIYIHASNICDAEEHAQILNTFACVKMQRMYMHAQVRLFER